MKKAKNAPDQIRLTEMEDGRLIIEHRWLNPVWMPLGLIAVAMFSVVPLVYAVIYFPTSPLYSLMFAVPSILASRFMGLPILRQSLNRTTYTLSHEALSVLHHPISLGRKIIIPKQDLISIRFEPEIYDFGNPNGTYKEIVAYPIFVRTSNGETKLSDHLKFLEQANFVQAHIARFYEILVEDEKTKTSNE